MASLTGTQINNTYPGLIKTTDNAALSATAKALTDGVGNALTMSASTAGIDFSGNIDFSAATVTGLPGGGGAGLINGIGANSLTNDASLVTTAPTTGGTFSLILGNDAGGATTGIVALGAGAGQLTKSATNNWSSVAIGQNAKFNANGCISLGPASEAYGVGSIAIGDNPEIDLDKSFAIGRVARCTSYFNGSLGDNARSQVNFAMAYGANAYANGEYAMSFGYNSQSLSRRSVAFGDSNRVTGGEQNTIFGGRACLIPSGDGNVLIGVDAITMPTGQNDNVGIGRITGFGAGTSNATAIGLVSQVGDFANDSVAIGRQAVIGNGATNSVAVGAFANVTGASNATAIGYNISATKNDKVATGNLDIVPVGGSIIMKSPDGTEWTITVDNTGTLVVS